MNTPSEHETDEASIPRPRSSSNAGFDDEQLDAPLEARSKSVEDQIRAHLVHRCGVDAQAIGDCFVWNGLQSDTEIRKGPNIDTAFLRRAEYEFRTQAERTRSSADRAMLCLWVRQCAWDAWHYTYRFNLLTRSLERFRESVSEQWHLDEEPDPVVELALRLCGQLCVEIGVEDHLKSGSRIRYGRALETAVQGCVDLLEAAESLSGPIAAFVQGEVSQRLEYHRRLQEAERALLVQSRLEYGPDSAVGIEKPRIDLRLLAKHSRLTSYELSKLNALRQALERLQEAQDDDRLWMRVDDGRIVYVFPFGVSGLDFATIKDRLKRAFEHRRESGPGRSGQVCPIAITDHFTAYADIWEPHLPQDKRFDGLEVRLPTVRLRIDEERTEELRASVRFSPMGVNCLRLERRLENVYPSELHATMFRAAREHGAIEVTCGKTDATWDRLARFARDVVLKQLPELLASEEGACDRSSKGLPVTMLRGRSHVLVRVLRASERRREFEPPHDGDGWIGRMAQDAPHLLNLIGASVLTHSAPDAKESLWDWVRLSDDHSGRIVNQRNEGDMLISTENTTVIASLDTPNFISGDLEAIAEFTACLSGTLAAWNHELDRYRANVTDCIDAYNEQGADRSALLEKMKTERARMLGFESETRQVISLLHSPTLLRSPSNAAALRRLLAVSGVDEQVETFEARLSEVVADQSEATLQRWEEDRRQRVRDSATAAVSALSICAAISIWQAAGFWTPQAWGWATVVVAAWAVTYVTRQWVSYNGVRATARFVLMVPFNVVGWLWTRAAARRLRQIAK
jgi:hypothetical protein